MIKIKDLLNEAIDEEMQKDENVFIIGEEIGRSGGPHNITKDLFKKYGDLRVIDAPISEIGFTGMAVGASFLGLKPIVDFMTWNFSLQAIDHIINSCAKTNYMSGGRIKSSMVFRGPNGFNGGYAAQHTQDFASYFGQIPGLKVVAPYTGKDHKGLLKSAIIDENPVVFLENEMLYNDSYSEVAKDYYQDLSKAVVEKKGSDVTVVGISLSLKNIFEANKLLEPKGINIEIINLISIRPLDIKTIHNSVLKTKRLIIVDYSYPLYSIASEISSSIYELCSSVCKDKIVKLLPKDVPTPYSSCLEDSVYPSVDDIIYCVNNMLGKK